MYELHKAKQEQVKKEIDMSGKGSTPRPFSVSQEEFDKRFDTVFGNKPKKEQYVPPPLPDMTVEKKKIDWGNDANKSQ